MAVEGSVSAGPFKIEYRLDFDIIGKWVSGKLFKKYIYQSSDGVRYYPNKRLEGWWHHARFKEAIINDVAVKYFEYAYWGGSSCRCQVEAPPKYRGLTTQQHDCDSPAQARDACVAELQEHINLD